MTYDLLYEAKAEPVPRRPLLARIRQAWAEHRARRRERRTAQAISVLDERLLRDIGLEPQDVAAALAGRPSPSILFHPMRRSDY